MHQHVEDGEHGREARQEGRARLLRVRREIAEGCRGQDGRRNLYGPRSRMEVVMSERRTGRGTDRRTFLKTAGAAAGATALAGFPAVLRAQVPTFKVGVIHPVTGPIAEPGQACRLGAQMAAEAISAAGGIKSDRKSVE